MKYRKLRIAWSVAWGTVAMLLCVLWVRSLYWIDYSYWYYSDSHCLKVFSVDGRLAIERRNSSSGNIWEHMSTRFHVPQTHYDMNGQRVSSAWFQVMRFSDFNQYEVPYWFCAMVPALLATLPWRFSLRTLLIATTLVAVGLGVVVWLHAS